MTISPSAVVPQAMPSKKLCRSLAVCQRTCQRLKSPTWTSSTVSTRLRMMLRMRPSTLLSTQLPAKQPMPFSAERLRTRS
ncbi:hypothetical protein LB503_012690 [Fusarium chuoi]|nr:hypothetical protein LB503_012690 [Fusarium chuoi]